jgi:hypothetical protein
MNTGEVEKGAVNTAPFSFGSSRMGGPNESGHDGQGRFGIPA